MLTLKKILGAPPDLFAWLRSTQKIRTVIDLGAHTGEYSEFLSSFFRAEATYAFEPLPECVAAIEAKSHKITNLKIFNCALSDQAGRMTFYRNSYGPSSSLLRVAEIHKREFPETRQETPLTVNVSRLDDLLDPSTLKKDVLIKMDVQGAEDKVIRGGRKLFALARCVLVEMSFVAMYEGQPLFEEIHSLLSEKGLRFHGMKNQINSKETGQPLFCHCLYVRGGEEIEAKFS